MSRLQHFALNQTNLAMLGMLDDFESAYRNIIDIYCIEHDKFKEENGNAVLLWPNNLEKICNSSVRKICTQLLIRYTSIFTDEYRKVYANTYGFLSFRMLDISEKIDEKKIGLTVGFISLNRFLQEIQICVTRTLHQWKTRENPLSDISDVFNNVNSQITKKVDEARKNALTIDEHSISVDDTILYLIDTLYTTLCRKTNYEKSTPLEGLKQGKQRININTIFITEISRTTGHD